MPFIELSEVEQLEKVPGMKARFVHSENMTFAHWEIRKGAVLPEHSHPHEQVANMVTGEFELTIDGTTRRLIAGSIAIIPSNAVHSGVAITDCRIIDAFYPIREDYR